MPWLWQSPSSSLATAACDLREHLQPWWLPANWWAPASLALAELAINFWSHPAGWQWPLCPRPSPGGRLSTPASISVLQCKGQELEKNNKWTKQLKATWWTKTSCCKKWGWSRNIVPAIRNMVPYLLTPSAVCFVLLTAAAALAEKYTTKKEDNQWVK